MGETELKSDEKIAHLHRGFASIRESIQFLDTKTNVVIGLSSVAAGFCVTLTKWLFELPATNSASLTATFGRHSVLLGFTGIFFVLSLIAFLVVIVFSVWSVISRGATPGAVTLIFPTPRDGVADLRAAIRNAINELSLNAVYAEYEDQLCRLGTIFRRKHRLLQSATISLLVQLLLLVMTVAVYGVAVIL